MVTVVIAVNMKIAGFRDVMPCALSYTELVLCCGIIAKLLPDSKYMNFVKYFSYCGAWGSIVVKALRY